MSAYASQELQESEKNPDYYQYSLKGVVVHMGNSDWGHYYSLIKNNNE